MKSFKVTGMSCAACSARVEKAVKNVEGVTLCEVNLLTGRMRASGGTPEDIIHAVTAAGYGISEIGEGEKKEKFPSVLSFPFSFFFLLCIFHWATLCGIFPFPLSLQKAL